MADKQQAAIGRGRGKVVTGRGRGRGRPSTPPKPPNEETIASLIASTTAPQAEVQQSPEQFLNASPSSDFPLTPPSCDLIPVTPPSHDLLPVTPPSHDNLSPGPSTTLGEGKTPPLVQDLKNALQGGVKVTQLNPHSPEFSPSTKGPSFLLSNGPSSSFSTNNVMSQVPVMTKMQLPSLAVPGLNLSASEFVPSFPLETGCENGFESLSLELPPGELLSLDKILSGFDPVTQVAGLAIHPVMKAAAEMLVKGTLYIGSFEHFQENVLSTINTSKTFPALFENLAEMLVYWGVVESYFCYTSCKMCEFISDHCRDFLKALLPRMRAWYIKETHAVSDEHYRIINFSLFLSELFCRLKIGGKPIEILAERVFSLIDILLTWKCNETVIGACNILKLTGSLLESCDQTEKMGKVIDQLKELLTESSLSRSCTELLARVIEQHTRRWGRNGGVSTINVRSPLALEDPPPTQESKGKLNASAAPFIPTNFQLQLPVTSLDEWKDFATDYESEPVEPVTHEGVDYDFLDGGPGGNDGLDPDIELEMEAFIDEIEEHLLMQDFDPDLQHM